MSLGCAPPLSPWLWRSLAPAELNEGEVFNMEAGGLAALAAIGTLGYLVIRAVQARNHNLPAGQAGTRGPFPDKLDRLLVLDLGLLPDLGSRQPLRGSQPRRHVAGGRQAVAHREVRPAGGPATKGPSGSSPVRTRPEPPVPAASGRERA